MVQKEPLIFIGNLKDFEKGQNKKNLQESELLHLRSGVGLPIYNQNYRDFEQYVLSHVAKMNNQLRKYFPFEYCRSGILLDCHDPTMIHYKNRFPQNQFLVEGGHFFLKPACCANALKIWNSKKTALSKKSMVHEISDLYRMQSEGATRALRRGCYFTLPDYHLITIKDQVLKDFVNIKNSLGNFNSQLFGGNYLSFFKEIFRIDKEKFTLYKKFIEDLAIKENKTFYIDLLQYEDPNSKPYYELKYELAYTGGQTIYTLNTIQIDYLYPELFNLESNRFGPRPVLHLSQGSIGRIIQVLAIENRLPKKGIKVFCFDKNYSKCKFLKNIGCNILLDTTSKSVKDAIKGNTNQVKNYPLLVIYGPEEEKTGILSIIDRDKKQNYKLSVNEFVQVIHTQTYLKIRDILYTHTFK